MRKTTPQSHLFLVPQAETESDPPEITDEDLARAFEQVAFDLDGLLDDEDLEDA
jgi:hypothetical protein